MDFSIGKTFSLMMRTLPFLVFRFLVYIGIAIGYMVVIGIGAGIGAVVGSIGGDGGGGAGLGGLLGFAVASGIMYFLREYLLYLVKAGHVAVLTELLDGGDIPGGKGQIDYAQGVVRERFVESSVLFGVDQLIKAILKRFNRLFMRLADWLPLPGLDGVMKFISAVVNLSLTYLDEVILAWNIRNRYDNAWEGSREAIVLYAQNYKSVLKNAVFIALMIWALTFVVFLLVLAPAALIVQLFPGSAGILTLVIALLLAWTIKQAIIEPVGMCALMQVYFKVVEGQQPNPEWDGKLEDMSKKFRELKDKALSHGPQKSAGEPAPATQAPQAPPAPPAG